jgi:hypothetical protein
LRRFWFPALLLTGCQHTQALVPSGCPTVFPAGSRIETLELGVARLEGVACESVGGTPFVFQSSGPTEAVVKWSDSRAALRLEIWEGGFNSRLAVGSEVAPRCLVATTSAKPGLHVVRVCHATNSAVPYGSASDPSTATQFELTVSHP